jgi:hypothetical protein
MTEREWSKLCRNIFEKKCILMLGSEFPIELNQANVKTETTLSELLFQKISTEVSDYSRLPVFYDRNFTQKDLCQLARDFIFYSDSNQTKSREDLETLISEFYDLSPNITSEYFALLASLPFYFIVDTNYGNIFFDLMKGMNKKPKKGYYNYKGPQVPVSNISASYKKIGTEQEPYIYNLYGSIEELKSLAISDFDLIQLLSNIISKTPGLPGDVRAELAHEETSILFIGFGILSKNWYFRILLHALTSGNKKTMSYALDYLSNINYDQDPTVLFFKDELKVCLYHYDQKTFIETLISKYDSFRKRQAEKMEINSGNNQISLKEEIKVFISYKREDIQVVKSIVERLESNYITVLWDQSNDFTGAWKKRIEELIDNSDAFILMQSSNLKNETVNYVNVEIRLAIERANRYPRLDNYLFPAYIDSDTSRLTESDFAFIKDINNWDLSTPENIDRIIKEIIRNKERNKKNNAA